MLFEYDIDDKSQFNIGMSRKGNRNYPHKNVMNKMGSLEGWNKEKEDAKQQWYYNTLINHPGTGYTSQKQNKDGNKIIKITSEQYERFINHSLIHQKFHPFSGLSILTDLVTFQLSLILPKVIGTSKYSPKLFN